MARGGWRLQDKTTVVSSVLFTIALACLIPPNWANASAGHNKLEGELRMVAQLFSWLGIADLTIILIGLIVIWNGYVKRARWSWFVMFAIVWLWVFPVMIMPLFNTVLTLSEWFSAALKQWGPARDAAEQVFIFALMNIALLLPVKSFFQPKASPGAS